MIRVLQTCLLALPLLAGCSGEIERGGQFSVPGQAAPDDGAFGSDPGAPRAEAAGRAGAAAGRGASDAAAGRIQRVGIHRLNNREYDNTIRDLLGVEANAASRFIADEKALGFDNIADALGMTEAQYEQYWNAADALAEQVFADRALRERIVTCRPAPAGDRGCAREIIGGFGGRAFRRPLANDEIDALDRLAQDALAAGEDFDGSIEQVVKALLASVHFLYRVELDPDPDSPVPHALTAHELASRLSYLLWSTMPDPQLLALAATGELLQDSVLRAQVDRLLASERAREFVAGFGGQWLGLRGLSSHQVDQDVFPEWDAGLQSAMVEEGLAYFEEFMEPGRGMDEFFTADVNFVEGQLAELYGLDGDYARTTRVVETGDRRRGFLGLASFLTLTSFAYRTAPTLRGKWVLENLLCEEIAPPPPNVPELDDEEESGAMPQSVNVRERLAAHRENPQCASCHEILDPIGLGLENFDAIGRYREEYAPGDAIDASGSLPSGEAFSGIEQLSALLSADARLPECASEKLLTYALSRQLTADDTPFLAQLRAAWAGDGSSLRALIERIVLSEPFRMRAGEAP